MELAANDELDGHFQNRPVLPALLTALEPIGSPEVPGLVRTWLKRNTFLGIANAIHFRAPAAVLCLVLSSRCAAAAKPGRTDNPLRFKGDGLAASRAFSAIAISC